MTNRKNGDKSVQISQKKDSVLKEKKNNEEKISNQLLKNEILELEKKIEKYNKAYYDDNKSLISDYEYDLLKKKLEKMIEEYQCNVDAIADSNNSINNANHRIIKNCDNNCNNCKKNDLSTNNGSSGKNCCKNDSAIGDDGDNDCKLNVVDNDIVNFSDNDYNSDNNDDSITSDNNSTITSNDSCRNDFTKQRVSLFDDFFIGNNVGYKSNDRFAKITHKKKMLSLANALSLEEFQDFVDKTDRFLKTDIFPISVCELKIDGLSFSAMYHYGKLEYVATRGDGMIGEDVTKNVLQIENFPKELKKIDKNVFNKIVNNCSNDADINFNNDFKQPCELETFEVRGEIFMPKDMFEKINEQLDEKSKFSNPRNAASGTLRQLDENIVKQRHLGYYSYFISEASDEIVNSQSQALKMLELLGFNVEKHWKIAKTTDEIIKFHEEIAKIRYELDCDIDGIVVKINSFDKQNELGITAVNPRWAIAYKFSGITAITKIIGIKNQVGRTGVVTPVAELMPVNIGGVIVKRATLHNYDEITRLNIGIGDEVVVKRAGDVIPKIISVEKKNNNSQSILIPKICPCCNTELESSDDYVAITCPNHDNCKDQIIDKIRHFCSREGFNITGLGKQNIMRFYELGLLRKITDIFEIYRFKDKFEALSGFGVKSVDNLLSSIEEKKNNIVFNNFLYALGIGDVGENVAKILATYYKNLDELLEDRITFSKVENINGLGEKNITNLIKYFNDEDNLKTLNYLNSICNIQQYKNASAGRFNGKSLVFTGTLQTMTRAQAKVKAEALGFKILTEISKNTDYLVYGDNAGSKLKKAKENGGITTILTEKEWLKMITDN